MKILILTAGYGEGHNSAARGIQSALARFGSRAVVDYHDPFAETYTWFHPQVRKAYLGLINNWPRAWGYVYNWLDRKKDFPADFRKFKRLRENLRQLLERFQPDAIVSVFPAYPYILEPLLQGTKTRSIAVVTDSITVNAIWYRSQADYFILPNEQSADVLRRAGVAESRIKVLGFPVDPRFADLPRRPAPSAECPARVLYMINAGTKRAPETARLLSRLNIQLTVTVGHDQDLRKRVEAGGCPRESGDRRVVQQFARASLPASPPYRESGRRHRPGNHRSRLPDDCESHRFRAGRRQRTAAPRNRFRRDRQRSYGRRARSRRDDRKQCRRLA